MSFELESGLGGLRGSDGGRRHRDRSQEVAVLFRRAVLRLTTHFGCDLESGLDGLRGPDGGRRHRDRSQEVAVLFLTSAARILYPALTPRRAKL